MKGDPVEKTRKTRALDRAPMIDDLDAMLTPTEAARYLAVSDNLMRKWRRSGGGPDYIRLSTTKIGYKKRDLIAFQDSRRFSSTSEEAAQEVSERS